MLIQDLEPTRFEKIIRREKKVPLYLRTILAGSSRATRLSLTPGGEKENIVTRISSGFLAPLVFLFVWWVLREAYEKRIRRLYFLARDGFIMKEVAEVLVKNWGLDIELNYLYCSRESLFPPSLSQVTDFELYWLTWGYLSSISLKEICERGRVTIEDLSEVFVNAGLGHLVENPAMPISATDLGEVKKCLLAPVSLESLKKGNRELFEAATGYLTQEGMFDEISYALVDTGWKGTSQYALSRILERTGRRPAEGLRGFYLGVNADKFIYKTDKLKAFLFDWSVERRDYQLYNFLCFEILFSAKHPRTTHYLKTSQRYEPILAEVGPTDSFGRYIDIQHACSRILAENASRLLSFSDFSPGGASLCKKLARAFISAPTEAEAKLYGELPLASEMREKDFQRFAPPMTFIDLITIALGRHKVKGFWPQGSMARSNMKLALLGYRMFLDSGMLDWYRKYFLKY